MPREGLQFLILNRFYMDNEQQQRCDNCGQLFPESKIGTHFAYCRRNIKKCPTCKQMYDINFQEEHEEEFHKQETCPHCSKSFPSSDFRAHETTCPQKPKYCEYCELNVPVGTYPTHLKECESRTKPCNKCNRPITNKDYLIHIVSCDGVREEPKPRSYQQHIQEQRRVIDQNKPNSNSRDNPKPYTPYAYEQREPRQQKEYREIKNREERNYAPIAHERQGPQGSKVVSYLPPSKQEVKVQEKKFNRVEPKRQEPKLYNKPVNPPPPTFSSKPQEVRQSGKITSNNQPPPNPQIAPSQRQGLGSRDVKQPVSNKDIFAYNNGKATVKNAKSIERPNEVPRRPEIRREEKPSREIYVNPTSNPNRAPVPQQRERVVPQPEIQQPRAPGNRAYLQEEYELGGALDMSYDHQMQMALMQSIEQKGSKKQSGYQFESEFNDPEFLAQQRAIEEQLRKNKQRR